MKGGRMKTLVICLTVTACVWIASHAKIEIKTPQFFRVTNAIEFPQLNKEKE